MYEDPRRGLVVLLVILAIIYLIWPLDFVPDPCFLDDAVVVAGAAGAALKGRT